MPVRLKGKCKESGNASMDMWEPRESLGGKVMVKQIHKCLETKCKTLIVIMITTFILFSVLSGVDDPVFASNTPSVGGSYFPLNPIRIADSRCDLGVHPLGNGNSQQLRIEGSVGYTTVGSTESQCPTDSSLEGTVPQSSGIPSTGVSAVVLNVTVIDNSSTSGGYISVTPNQVTGGSPATSTINFSAGEIVSSQATVGLSQVGSVSIYGHLGSPDGSGIGLVIDALGYFSSLSQSGSTYYPLSTAAVIANSGISPCGGGSIFPSSFLPLPESGGANILSVPIVNADELSSSTCGTNQPPTVPLPSSDNPTAVIVSITAINASSSAAGYVTVAPSGTYSGGLSNSVSFTSTSTINLAPSQTASNTATVNLTGNDIQVIAIGSASGDISMQISLVGYYSSNTTGSLFVPMVPPSRIANSIGCGNSPVPSSMYALPTSGGINYDNLTVAGQSGVSGCSSTFQVIPAATNTTVTGIVAQVGTDNAASVPIFITTDNQSSPPNLIPSLSVGSSSISQAETVIPLSSGSSAGIGLEVNPQNSGNIIGTGDVTLEVDITGYYISQSTPTISTSGAYYFPLDPVRIANTLCSPAVPSGFGQFSNATTRSLPIAGASAYSSCGVTTSSNLPSSASAISAVVLNVTAVNPSSTGYLTVAPSISGTPPTETVSFASGVNTAAEVTVPTDSSGDVDVYASLASGTVDVIVDVEGYYGASTSNGDPYIPVPPIRIADSVTPACPNSFVAFTGTEDLSLASIHGCNSPSTLSGLPSGGNFTAVVLSVTVLSSTSTGFLNAYPTGTTEPPTSNINFGMSDYVNNLITVEVSASGDVTFATSASSNINVIIDLEGYYVSNAASVAGDAFVPITPFRAGANASNCPTNFTAPSFGIPAILTFGGANASTTCSSNNPIPATLPSTGIDAIASTITATDNSSSNGGYLSIYPCGAPLGTSNAQLNASETTTSSIAMQLCSDRSLTFNVVLANSDAAAVSLSVDITGWFTGSTQSVVPIAGDGNNASGTLPADNTKATNTSIDGPAGLTEDGYGDVFYTDQSTSTIFEINHAGLLTKVAGTGSWGFNGDNTSATSAELHTPSGLATTGFLTGSAPPVDPSNIYLADTNNCLVRELVPTGATDPPSYSIQTVIGDVSGSSAVCASSVPPDKSPAIGTAIGKPGLVAVDSEGDVFFSDLNFCNIYEVPAASTTSYGKTMNKGEIYTIAGTGSCGSTSLTNGSSAGTNVEMNWALGLAIDGAGYLYISDSLNEVVWQLSPSGTISRFAGIYGINGYTGDGGPGTSAELYHPKGIAIEPTPSLTTTSPLNSLYNPPEGRLMISDSGNHRVRLISGGKISTIVGNGEISGPISSDVHDIGLNDVSQIYLAPSGDLIMADNSNYTIEEHLV